jgi:hypothetical protein
MLDLVDRQDETIEEVGSAKDERRLRRIHEKAADSQLSAAEPKR